MTTRRPLPRLPALAIGLVLVTSACGQIDAGFELGNSQGEDAGTIGDESSTTVATSSERSDDDATTSTGATTTRPTSAPSVNTTNTSTPSSDTRDSTSRTIVTDDTSTTSAEQTSTSADSEASESASTEVDQTTSDETGTDDSAPGDEVPMTDHCALVADWDVEWSQWEDEVLLLVNDYRAEGADCGEKGVFGPAEPLEMDAILRCSSRLHSLDMFDRMYFDHENPDGLDPFERMDLAGFNGSYMGENIAMGQTDPEEVMEAWLDSDGHCSNVLSPNFTLIGVGYYPGSPDNFRARNYWTQNFGAPRQSGGGMGGRRND